MLRRSPTGRNHADPRHRRIEQWLQIFSRNLPILITLPRILKNEAETPAALCGAGVSVIHIRKPEASEPEIEELLKTLQALGADMSRLTIHYNEPLARKYGLGGVHLRIEGT